MHLAELQHRNSNRLQRETLADRDSVAELEAHGCADGLLVSQHGGGYDRGAQDGAQIPANAQQDTSARPR